MQAAEALIFDMDGLLIDTETLYVRVTQQIVGPYGHTVTAEDYADWIGRDVSYADFQALYPVPIAEDELWQRSRQLFASLCETDLTMMPGALAFLDGVAAGYPKVVASSTARPTIARHLTQLGIIDRFAALCSARDVPRGKPHPDVYLAAAAALGVEPAACVVFEDSTHGVVGAKAAGMRAVAVPTELTAHLPFAEADLRVERLTEVSAAWLRGEV